MQKEPGDEKRPAMTLARPLKLWQFPLTARFLPRGRMKKP
jgi:hypothetical protein